jgi:hypothetical protein
LGALKWSSKSSTILVYADLDPAFHFDAEPDPASQDYSDPQHRFFDPNPVIFAYGTIA